MRFDLSFDLRNPPWSGKPFDRFYADFLDLAAWADGQGFDRIGLSEHHFVEDGYLPSPFVAAGAVAARTKNMRISISLVLLPLKHPVQTAGGRSAGGHYQRGPSRSHGRRGLPQRGVRRLRHLHQDAAGSYGGRRRDHQEVLGRRDVQPRGAVLDAEERERHAQTGAKAASADHHGRSLSGVGAARGAGRPTATRRCRRG